MKTAIAVIGYDRLDYFKTTVQSIARSNEATKFPIHVFLDDSPNIEEHIKITRRHLNGAFVHRQHGNIGCGRNLIRARRHLFDSAGYERVFVMEDDLVVTPSYFTLMSRLMDWTDSLYDNVGIVQGWSNLLIESNEKKEKAFDVKETWRNLWGYLISKRCWDSIKNRLYDYEETYLSRGSYGRRPHRDIVRFFNLIMSRERRVVGDQSRQYEPLDLNDKKAFFVDCPSGQDAATSVMMWFEGWARLTTVVSRSKYIGAKGIHMNPEWYRKEKFDRYVLEEMEGDRTTHLFNPVGA